MVAEQKLMDGEVKGKVIRITLTADLDAAEWVGDDLESFDQYDAFDMLLREESVEVVLSMLEKGKFKWEFEEVEK
jgi:hypothetical protein